MSRTGSLSDAAILEHCKIYRPIPMKATQSILHQENFTPFGSKKLKYAVMPNRPKNFDTMATSLSRIAGNETVRQNLEVRYNEQVKTALAAPQHISLPQRATAVNLQRSSSETFTPMNTSDLARRASELFEEMDAPATPSTPARPMTFPRISIQELIDRRTPKPDDEDTPQFEDVTPRPARMNADVLARREALVDSGIAARALQTPGRMVLRNRSFVSAAVAAAEQRAKSTAIQQLEAQLMGLEVNSPEYMATLEQFDEDHPEY